MGKVLCRNQGGRTVYVLTEGLAKKKKETPAIVKKKGRKLNKGDVKGKEVVEEVSNGVTRGKRSTRRPQLNGSMSKRGATLRTGGKYRPKEEPK